MPSKVSPQLRQNILRAARAAEHDRSPQLTVDALAENAGVSSKHFQRAFREVVGESPKHYVRRLRLQAAAYLLKWSDMSVTDISAEAGFDTGAGFTKAFVKAYGRSPSDFRKATGVAPYLRTTKNANELPPGDADRLETSRLVVRIEETPTRRVAAIRHIGPTERLAEVWPKMTAWANRRGLLDDRAVLLGIHNDYWDANAEDRYRYDAAIVVPDDFVADEEVITFTLPGGEVAMTEFAGSVAQADDAWRRFVDQWLPISGYTLRTNYTYDRYPVDLVAAGPLARLLQTLTGIRATLCLPIEK